MRVDWLPSVSPEVRAIFEPDIQKLLWLLPTWVQEFFVDLDGEKTCGMESSVNYDYRRFVLTLTGHSLQATNDRKDMLCHEFAHAYTTPIKSKAMMLIDSVLPEDKDIHKIADDILIDHHEGMTTDLGKLFYKIVYEGARG